MATTVKSIYGVRFGAGNSMSAGIGVIGPVPRYDDTRLVPLSKDEL